MLKTEAYRALLIFIFVMRVQVIEIRTLNSMYLLISYVQLKL